MSKIYCKILLEEREKETEPMNKEKLIVLYKRYLKETEVTGSATKEAIL